MASAGKYHTVLVLNDGTGLAFGHNTYGQRSIPDLGGRRIVLAKDTDRDILKGLHEDGTMGTQAGKGKIAAKGGASGKGYPQKQEVANSSKHSGFGISEATPEAQQAIVVRFADVEGEPLQALSPIRGVLKVEAMPLMDAAIATGLADMDAEGFMASERGKEILMDSNPHELEDDEAGALNLYTKQTEFYPTVNSILRDRDRQKLKPYFPLLRLMILARAKLPKFTGVVWRGVRQDLRALYPEGKQIYWWAFSSTTIDIKTLENEMFLGTEGVRTCFMIEVLSGTDISAFSDFPEAEILLFPGTKLQVKGNMDMGHGLFMVQLAEVAVPVELFT